MSEGLGRLLSLQTYKMVVLERERDAKLSADANQPSQGAGLLTLKRAAVCVSAGLEESTRFYNAAFGFQLLASLDAPQAPRAVLASGEAAGEAVVVLRRWQRPTSATLCKAHSLQVCVLPQTCSPAASNWN